MRLDTRAFSQQYEVRFLKDADVPQVYALCRQNALYYQYCPPFVTADSIRKDMLALPSTKTADDKYYVGYFDGNGLVAVLDLIMEFPDEDTAWIGFFMTDVSIQSKGVGSAIISDLCTYLSGTGISCVRLGWVRGNPQAAHFWHKNRFAETGAVHENGAYAVAVAQRML